MPAILAGAPADYVTASPSPTKIAGYILHGIGDSTQDPTKTISIPRADIVWQDRFPTASISHAQSCWSAYTDWFASYPNYYATASPSLSHTVLPQLSTYYYPTSSTIWPIGNVSTYKLCDGSPRASYSPSTTSFSASIVSEGYTWSTAYPTPIPEQACTLNQADCAVMYFGTNLNDLNSSVSDNEWAMERLLAACGLPLDLDVPCLVQGGPVELLYFPISTTGGDVGGCIRGQTITPVERPAPVITLGTTFYPDKVYVSFETLYAAYRSLAGPGGAAVQLGKGYTNKIFEFRSEEISTNCFASFFSSKGHHNAGYGPGTQLNYADLNYPPPASAYNCQRQCQSLSYERDPSGTNVTTHTILPNPCETIWDNFNPLIAVPTRLRSMHPEWSTCQFWNTRQGNVVFDPPIALTQASAVAKPTLPGGYGETTEAAMPASTGTRPASKTAAAVADHLLSTTRTKSGDSSTGEPTKTATSMKSHDSQKVADAHSSVIAFTPVTSQAAATFGAFSLSAHQVLAAGDITITAVPISKATDLVEIDGSTVSIHGPGVTTDGVIVSMGTSGLVAIHTSTASASRSTTTAGNTEVKSSSVDAESTTSGSGEREFGECFLLGHITLAVTIPWLLLF